MKKFPILFVDGADSADLRDNVIRELMNRNLYASDHWYRTFRSDRLETMLKTGNDRTNEDGKGDLQYERDFRADLEALELKHPELFDDPDNDCQFIEPETSSVAALCKYPIENTIHASTQRDAELDELTAWKLAMDYVHPVIAVYRNSHLDVISDNECVFKRPSKKLEAVVAVFTVGWKYEQSKKKRIVSRARTQNP